MAQPTPDLSSSLPLTSEPETPVVAISLYKTIQQQLAVQHFVDTINSLTTLYHSLPVKTEYDQVTDTYTRGAIRSWHMLNIGLLNPHDQHYRQEKQTLQRDTQQWEATLLKPRTQKKKRPDPVRTRQKGAHTAKQTNASHEAQNKPVLA